MYADLDTDFRLLPAPSTSLLVLLLCAYAAYYLGARTAERRIVGQITKSHKTSTYTADVRYRNMGVLITGLRVDGKELLTKPMPLCHALYPGENLIEFPVPIYAHHEVIVVLQTPDAVGAVYHMATEVRKPE